MMKLFLLLTILCPAVAQQVAEIEDGKAASIFGGRRIRVQGTYTPILDFSLFKPTSVLDGKTCLIQAPLQLILKGDIESEVDGVASVHVDLPCDGVTAGETGADVLLVTADSYAGFVRNKLAVGGLSFAAETGPTGVVTGKIVLEGNYFGTLDVEGVINVGGTYKGFLRSVAP